MADIFEVEGITPKAVGARDLVFDGLSMDGDLTAPAYAPNPPPSFDPVADMESSDFGASNDNEDDALPAVPAYEEPEFDAEIDEPEAEPDLFAAEGIAPPGLEEQNINALNAGISLDNPDGEEEVEALAPLAEEQEQINAIAKTRFSPEQLEDMRGKPITFFEAFSKLRPNWDRAARDAGVPAGIIPKNPLQNEFDDVYNTFKVGAIAEKVNKGEVLGEMEQNLLNEYLDYQVETSVRGFTMGGKIARGLAALPSFVVQFAMTGGAGAAAKKAAVEGLKRTAITGVTAKVAGITAEVATRSALMPGYYLPKYGERRLNNFSAITDKGDLVFRQGDESPAKSALLSYAYTNAEVGSEMSGAMLGKYLVKPFSNAVKTPLISAVNNLPAGLRDSLYQVYKTINPNAQVSKVFTALGWNGMLEELGEERVNDVVQSFIGLAGNDTQAAADKQKFTYDDFLNTLTPSKDQLLVEAGIIGIAGGVHVGSNMMVNMLKNNGMTPEEATETVNNLSAIEVEQFVQDNLETPRSAYPTLSMEEIDRNYNDWLLASNDGFVQRLNALRNPPAEPRQESLLSFVKRMGGVIDQGGELKAMDALRQRPGLINNASGRTLDDLALAAQEAGFFPDRNLAEGDRIEINDLLGAMDAELSGKKIYTQGGQEAVKAYQDQLRLNEEMSQILGNAGLSEDMPDVDIIKGLGLDIESLMAGNAPAAEELTGRVHMDGVPQNVSRETLPAVDGGKPTYHYEGDVINSQIKASEAQDPPPILNEESVFNKLYRELVNDIQPIVDLSALAQKRGAEFPAGKDPFLLSSLNRQIVGFIRQNLEVATAIRNEMGNMEVTGKSLKAIRDDFDNTFITQEPSRDARKQDFDDYQIAMRYLDEAQKAKEGKDVLVTEAQIAKSVADLAKLQYKYGENFHFFETFAQEERDFDRRILFNLVRSGLKTQEWYDQVLAANPKYVPLQRIMDEEKLAPPITQRSIFKDPNANRVVKAFKGSELEVKDITQSRMRNAARILQISATNDLLQSMAALESWAPEHVKIAPAPIVPKGKAMVKVSYDPKLRQKLEATITQMGATLERKKSLGPVKGFKNVLGSYSEAEKLVQMRIGSTEGTLAHEVGHMLDYELGLSGKMLDQLGIREELQTLALDRLNADVTLDQTPQGLEFNEKKKKFGKKYENYIKSDPEILANFFDAYVNSPDQARATAPNAVAAFEALLELDPNLAFLKDVKPSTARAMEEVEQDVWGPSDYGPPQSVPFYQNGERKFLQLSKPIFEAFSGLGPTQIGLAEKILAGPLRLSASILRTGATLTPEFLVRNPLRDMHTSFLQSGVKNTPVDFAKGLFAVLGRTDLYNQWERSGGKFDSYMALDDKGMEKAYKEIFAEKSKMAEYLSYANPLKLLSSIGEAGEQATRLGIFAKAKSLGMSDTEAALASLEGTLNFNRGGTLGKRLNRYVPFLNAGIQGIDKMVRAFKKDPAAMTFWSVATITVPSLMLTGFYLYGSDDRTRNEYLEFPQWEKDIFWHVKIAGEWRRYPKPFTLGYTFGSMPERIMTWMYDGNKPEAKDAWLSMVQGFVGSITPVNDVFAAIPPIMKSVIQSITNYDFFTGRSIYPKWMDSLEPAQRKTKYTSDLAQIAGEQFNVSPALIDNAVRTNTGGLGTYAMNAGDYILEQVKKWNGEKLPEKPVTEADIPVLKAFTPRPASGYRSQSSNNFFETWTEVQQKNATYNKLRGQEKSEYLKENRVPISQYKTMKAYYTEMRNLQKQVDEIYDHKNMTSAQKVERISKLEDQITQIARRANMQYSRAAGAQ